MSKKILFVIIIIGCIILLIIKFLPDKGKNITSYSQNDYETEIKLVKKKLSIKGDLNLAYSYDLIGGDRVRLFTSGNNLILVVASREEEKFTLFDAKKYSLEENLILQYMYSKNNKFIYFSFGYNKTHTAVVFKEKKSEKEITKPLVKDSYNVVPFYSDNVGIMVIE